MDFRHIGSAPVELDRVGIPRSPPAQGADFPTKGVTMSRYNLGLDRVAGGRPHHSSWQLTTGLVLMGLAFSIGLMCDQALADP